MATTDITFSGLANLRLRTVSVCIAGLDCGDFTVDAYGRIVVPITAHPSLSATYLARVAALGLDTPNLCVITIGDTDYLVPVTIGLSYTSKGQGLRPLEQNDIKSQTGGGLGKTTRGHQYSFLFAAAVMGQGTGALSVGTDFSAMYRVRLLQKDRATLWTDTAPFEGVHWDVLNDGSGFDTMLCWQVSRPVPLIIDACATHLHVEDR